MGEDVTDEHGPDASNEGVEKSTDVIEGAKKAEQTLVHEVLTFEPVVTEIVKQIDEGKETPPVDIMKEIAEGMKKLSEHIKGKDKDYGKAFEVITNLIKMIFGAGPAKPSYRNADRDSRKGKETDFPLKDIDTLFAKIKDPNLSAEKKLAFARLVSRRRDAEHNLEANEEPAITQEYLTAQVTAGYIQVGDIMIYGGPEKGGKVKEMILKAGVKADHTHAAVITSVNPLEITHATQKGVHTMGLMDYIKNHEQMSYAVISGGGSKEKGEKVREYSLSQKGKAYDLKNAIGKKFGDEETQFCSEHAIRSFAAGNGLDINELEQEGKIFPPHLLALSYPKYVGDYPRES